MRRLITCLLINAGFVFLFLVSIRSYDRHMDFWHAVTSEFNFCAQILLHTLFALTHHLLVSLSCAGAITASACSLYAFYLLIAGRQK